MAEKKYININFPFRDSVKGFFLDATETDAQAIKADLMHLILTKKGERYYMPDFGTNLLKFIFEPNDAITLSDIKRELKDTVKKYLPNLQINDVLVEPSEENEYTAVVRIDYTVTDDVFEETDFVIIQL
jgi:phage baseplate assembly protein W